MVEVLEGFGVKGRVIGSLSLEESEVSRKYSSGPQFRMSPRSSYGLDPIRELTTNNDPHQKEEYVEDVCLPVRVISVENRGLTG